ncbi:Protein kinase domain-containing protein [Aphelenchoides fujianensis]|nr:Protein kinase domain-containing protein [Aphelenchoides fujianensis]
MSPEPTTPPAAKAPAAATPPTPKTPEASGSANSTVPPPPRATPTIGDCGADFGQPLEAGTRFKGAEKTFTIARPLNREEPAAGYVNEVAVLAVVEARRALDPNAPLAVHFARLFDHWRLADGALFAACGLLGPPLADLPVLLGPLSRSTTVRLVLQTFEALRHLHQLGFVHADVRPASFAVGMRPREGIVYFRQLSRARPTASDRPTGFLGAVRYVSRAVAVGEPPQPRDDVESWLFVARELCAPESLPWRRLAQRRLVQRAKEEFFEQPERAPPGLPFEFARLTPLVAAFQGEAHYDQVGLLLLNMMKGARVHPDDPYDWQQRPELMQSGLFNARPRQKSGEAAGVQTITEESTSSEDSNDSAARKKDDSLKPVERVEHAEKPLVPVEKPAEKPAEKVETPVTTPPLTPPPKAASKPAGRNSVPKKPKKRASSRRAAKRPSGRAKATGGRTLTNSNSQTVSSDATQDEAEKQSKASKKRGKRTPASPGRTSGARRKARGGKRTDPPSSEAPESSSGAKEARRRPEPARPKVAVVAAPPAVAGAPLGFPPPRPFPNFYLPAAQTDCSLSSRVTSPTSPGTRPPVASLQPEDSVYKPPGRPALQRAPKE